MPSCEDMIYVTASSGRGTESDENTTQDFLSRDIENLVSEIKQNLKLSGFKTRYQRRISRASPYSNPNRSLTDCCELCAKNIDIFVNTNSKQSTTCTHRTTLSSVIKSTSTQVEDDPYEMLQDLLRDGGLIKEAVNRLQRGLSRKQRYHNYDSDEESASAAHIYKKNVEDLFGRNVEVYES